MPQGARPMLEPVAPKREVFCPVGAGGAGVS